MREKDDVKQKFLLEIHSYSHAKSNFGILCTRNQLGSVNAKVRLVRREVCCLICDSHPVRIFLLIPLPYTIVT